MSDATDHGRLQRKAATASVVLATSLVLLKLVAGLATGSVAILSSLIDSLADVVASAITFVSVRIARQPPDRRHRYGHGKAESLSALAQAALVSGSALFVVLQAAQRMIEPRPLALPAIGIVAMVIAIALTLVLVAFQRHVVRRTGSQAIAADSLHYRADLAANLAVLASLWATAQGWMLADPVIGLAVAAYLVWHALAIGRTAIDVLMDHELAPDKRALIERIVLDHPEVEGLHDLRTREAGSTQFIELHVEIDGARSVREAHYVTEKLEHDLTRAFPEAEVIIHQEPAGIEDRRLDHLIEAGGEASAVSDATRRRP